MPVKRNIEQVRKITGATSEEMSLEGLTMVPVLPELGKQVGERIVAEQAEFKAKYGKDWFLEWWKFCEERDRVKRG